MSRESPPLIINQALIDYVGNRGRYYARLSKNLIGKGINDPIGAEVMFIRKPTTQEVEYLTEFWQKNYGVMFNYIEYVVGLRFDMGGTVYSYPSETVEIYS